MNGDHEFVALEITGPDGGALLRVFGDGEVELGACITVERAAHHLAEMVRTPTPGATFQSTDSALTVYSGPPAQDKVVTVKGSGAVVWAYGREASHVAREFWGAVGRAVVEPD